MLCLSALLKLNYSDAPRTQTLLHSNRDATSLAADFDHLRISVDQIERKAGQANHPELRGRTLAFIDQRVFSLAA